MLLLEFSRDGLQRKNQQLLLLRAKEYIVIPSDPIISGID